MKTQTYSKIIVQLICSFILLHGYAQTGCPTDFDVTRGSWNLNYIYFASPHQFGAKYKWDFGDGTAPETYSTNNTAHHFYESKIYNVCLTVIDSLGKPCATFCKDVDNRYPCPTSFKKYVYKNKVRFEIEKSTTTRLMEWDFGDGEKSTAYPTNEHRYLKKGTYYVCLKIHDTPQNCYTTICDSIKIDKTDCDLEFNVFNKTTKNIEFVMWGNQPNFAYTMNYGDGSTEKIKGSNVDPLIIKHTYPNATKYVACLTMVDSLNDCGSVYCDSLNISTCSADFSFIHNTFLHEFNFMPLLRDNSFNYLWSFGDGTNSTLQEPKHSYATGGTHWVRLIITSNTDKDCHDTVYKSVRDDFPKNCVAAFDLKDDPSSANPNDLIMINKSIGNNLVCDWDYKLLHEFDIKLYSVCLSIRNNNGCYDYVCDTIQLKTDDSLHIKIIDSTAVGILSHKEIQGVFENYPNPFSESTTIHYVLKNSADVQLTVFDLLGNKIELIENTFKSAGDYKLNWQAPQLPPGMYLLQLKTNKDISTKKMVIQE
jgi:PKD repeat protein